MSGCDFRIGQKVVCVDAEPRPGMEWVYDDPPVVGKIYTISEIIQQRGETCFVFSDYQRASINWRGYRAARFRPLDEDRYDISIFQEMCVRAPKKLVSR